MLDRHPLAPISLRRILAALQAGTSTPAGEISAAKGRIATGDGPVRAFLRLAPEASLADAATAKGPLAGIAIGVKDIYDTFDMATEHGSPIYRDHRPVTDAALVSLARHAGAAIIGKTTTTEFASLDPTPTRNPRHLDHTPGGSSAGSAAAVAAGMVPLAFGSQTGGSVIRPASFCGVAGFKPSFRLLPTVGMKTFAYTLDTAGLFAARVEDLNLAASLITNRIFAESDRADAWGLTVGLYRSSVDGAVDEAMTVAVDEAGRLFEASGARLIDVSEPAALSAAREAHASVEGFEAVLALSGEYRQHRQQLGPKVGAILDQGAAIEVSAYDRARRTARIGRKAASELFETVDVLIAPSALGPAPASLRSTGDAQMNKLWTLTGNPVVTVPGFATRSGLPLGVSVIARFGCDAKALSAAALLQRLICA
ncbi:amidase [Jiella sp. MQZ9-1]|uniref:Amidase n=1 Tax=Jiella flava TaxID=2816857 RepID=A0A939JUY3_9HYPH|nr:amidase [Jiella flava]MBO0663635.1 amidase [Jiella flava]MCD2472210.1 amidase [Jiella flava]